MIDNTDNTRRMLLTTLILVLSVLACAIQPPTTPSDNTQGAKIVLSTTPTTPVVSVVTAIQSLNVRERAGTYQRVIGALYHDNTVVMTGKCSDDPAGWAEIVWKDGTAWVNADFLSKNKCSEEQ